MNVIRVVVTLLFLAFAAAAPGQQVFRTSTAVVPVYVTVRDAQGAFVLGLGRDDFEIYVDGRPTPPTLFTDEPEPLTAAIMLDTSISVAGVGHTGRPDAVLALLEALGPSDRAALGTFGAEIAIGNYANDLAEFRRVLREEVWIGGGTPLWQALWLGLESVCREPGRRAVIVYTDGVDTGSLPGRRVDQSDVVRRAIDCNCMLYFVRPFLRDDRPIPRAVVQAAVRTGGRVLEVQQRMDLERAFTDLAAELRHQYLLGFVPRGLDGEVHRLDVKVKKPGLVVSARREFREASR